ncbi:HPr kinase/phosphorylase [Jiella marina]|uniref:HPr kinase/phosphorylase n=1 Tax=Jiella sp. LLJ827 TaxID=2917712 RepID=UPI002100E7FE|nr:HPr kinase/phosphorylase [Jiella sp. LLJ827]MCQ0989235.1 HPr kinase/phosphorylase [Jiella sp. LLJ827]
MTAPVNLHGCALAIGDDGLLIRGAARSGKSALTLAILRRAPGLGLDAALVADDRVNAERRGETVMLSAPETLKGLIELSGVGIVEEPVRDDIALRWIVDLVDPATVARYPTEREAELMGLSFPVFRLPMHEAALNADILLTLSLPGRRLR